MSAVLLLELELNVQQQEKIISVVHSASVSAPCDRAQEQERLQMDVPEFLRDSTDSGRW